MRFESCGEAAERPRRSRSDGDDEGEDEAAGEAQARSVEDNCFQGKNLDTDIRWLAKGKKSMELEN